MDFFDKNFFQQFLVTFVGVLVGIPMALWINRRQERREDAKRRQQEAERRRQIGRALWTAVAANRAVVERMREEIDGQVILYNVDLALLEATASMKYATLDDVETCQLLDQLRHELALLDQKLKLLLQIEHDISMRTLRVQTSQGEMTTYTYMRGRLVEATKAQLDTLLELSAKALARLDLVVPDAAVPAPIDAVPVREVMAAPVPEAVAAEGEPAGSAATTAEVAAGEATVPEPAGAPTVELPPVEVATADGEAEEAPAPEAAEEKSVAAGMAAPLVAAASRLLLAIKHH